MFKKVYTGAHKQDGVWSRWAVIKLSTPLELGKLAPIDFQLMSISAVEYVHKNSVLNFSDEVANPVLRFKRNRIVISQKVED